MMGMIPRIGAENCKRIFNLNLIWIAVNILLHEDLHINVNLNGGIGSLDAFFPIDKFDIILIISCFHKKCTNQLFFMIIRSFNWINKKKRKLILYQYKEKIEFDLRNSHSIFQKWIFRTENKITFEKFKKYIEHRKYY